jgi:lipopolysaccharide export system permease protein
VRILNKYLIQDFLVTFAMTLAVFTSVMCLGVIIKAIEVMARGISPLLIAKVFALNVPFMLTFSIPMSVLTAVLLVFGRMSFDGEITAMKACGISMWQIAAPVLVIAICFSAFCLSINTSIAPLCRWRFRALIAEVGSEDPAKLLEPGRFVRDFPGMMIYVSDRKGSEIRDVVVYELDPHGSNGVVKNIRAEYGMVSTDRTNQVLMVDLFNVHSDVLHEKNGEKKWEHIDAREYPYSVSLKDLLRKQQVRQKIGEMTYGDLIRGSKNIAVLYPELQPRDMLRQRMTMMVEANKRLSLSLSCFAFALLGIPLGMKSKRKESSVGVGISLALVFIFYLFIIIASQLVGRPQLRPDLIVWIPAIGAEILGFILIQRTN